MGIGLGPFRAHGDGPGSGAGAHDAAAGRLATPIKLDHFGYRPEDPKVVVFSSDPGQVVRIRSSSGAVAFTVPVDGGSIRSRGRDFASGHENWWVDLGRLEAPGRYHLWSASLQAQSYELSVAPGVYRNVMRAALRTFYLQSLALDLFGLVVSSLARDDLVGAGGETQPGDAHPGGPVADQRF